MSTDLPAGRATSPWRVLGTTLVVAVALALLLTGLLVRANPGAFGAGVLVELFAAMLWVALVTQLVFGLVLLLLWPLAARVLPRPAGGRPAFAAYWAAGLVALNLVWCLWNRLAMANAFASGKRRFLSTSGLIELGVLALVGFAAITAGTGLLGRQARGRSVVALVLAVVGSLGALAFGAWEESFHRRVPHADVRAAAAVAAEAEPQTPEPQNLESQNPGPAGEALAPPTPSGDSGRQRVVVIGADGIDWSVLTPLMEGGRLPHLASLVQEGAHGYLDNGDDSYSPVIWTTMFTGHEGRVHGVYDFQKTVLPRTGKGLPNPLLLPPTIDTFYGLKDMLGSRALQKPGLWHMAWVGARDRRVPTVWDVASHYERQVAICDALANQPARPVNGAILSLGRSKGAADSAFHPPELAVAWREARVADPQFEPTEAGRFEALSTRFDGEVTFALDALERYGTDFCFYYTYFVDSQCHSYWDFYAGDEFFLTDLPRSLSDEAWGEFVREHQDETALRSYVVLDEQLGRFRERFPEALFVIVSDHGWTFSGYEHFNSPDGVVLFSGPGVRKGAELEGMHIQDVAPTLLALLDVPVSRQLPGRVRLEALLDPPEPSWVDSYSDVVLRYEAGAGVDVSPEEEQRLRDIGYVK